MENNTTNSNQGKPKGMFTSILFEHNTTIIAIIMSLIAIQAEQIDTLKAEAAARAQETDQAYTELENDIDNIDNEEAELDIKYAGDTASAEFQNVDAEFEVRENALKLKAETAQVNDSTQEALYAIASKKENESNWAKEMSEIAVLLSAVGVSSKKSLLQYIAGVLTLIAMIIVLFTFL